MALDQVDVDKIGEAQEKEMSFLDHLEELRWHLVRAVIAIFVIGILVFVLEDFVIQTVLYGPRFQDFPTYQFFCGISDAICFYPPSFELNPREVGEAFFTHIKISIVIGLMVAFPYVFWEFWRFIKPALLEEELKASRGIIVVVSLLFVSGILFGYFVIAPFALTFLSNYAIDMGLKFEPTFSSYGSYMIMFTLPTGLVFQLPVVMYFLARVGLITESFLKTYRRHSFVIILVLAAIITPPDVVTQFLIGVPLYILYEASIVIVRKVEKKYAKENA